MDPLTIIFAAIAGFVLWRLWAVLGTRTGHERPPPQVFSKTTPQEVGETGKVLEFPDLKGKSEPATALSPEEILASPAWSKFVKPDSELSKKLLALHQLDLSFTPKSFVEGAKIAYEMVLEAFAKADKPTLKQLLVRDLYENFAQAIDERVKNSQKMTLQFIGFDQVELLSCEMNNKKARITMRFVSQMLSATYDKAGTLLEGSPTEVETVTDVWSFERDMTQRDPNWLVVATELA